MPTKAIIKTDYYYSTVTPNIQIKLEYFKFLEVININNFVFLLFSKL